MSSNAVKTPGEVYWLESLWWGVSIGGRHYTGKIHWYDSDNEYQTAEIERPLSLKEAKLLDPDRGEGHWRLGGVFRKTNRFDTKDQLERAATKWVKGHTKAPIWMLIDHDIHNPNRVIGSSGWHSERVDQMDKVAAVWNKLDNRTREDKKLWDVTYKAWRWLISETGPIT